MRTLLLLLLILPACGGVTFVTPPQGEPEKEQIFVIRRPTGYIRFQIETKAPPGTTWEPIITVAPERLSDVVCDDEGQCRGKLPGVSLELIQESPEGLRSEPSNSVPLDVGDTQ